MEKFLKNKIRNLEPIKFYALIYIPIILLVYFVMLLLGKNMFASIFKWTSYLRGDLIYSIKYLVNGYKSSDAHPYPPLVNLYYTLILNCTNILESGMDNTIVNRLLAFFINWTPIFITVVLINDYFKKNGYFVNLFYIVLLAIPAPLFTSLRSGNYTYMIIPFTLYYVFNYDSDNKIKKEIALITLAISSNLKIIPAVYSLLLIDNKDIRSFIKYVFYSALLFFIPIFFIMPYLNYYDRLLLMINSMLKYSGGYLYNLTGSLRILYHALTLIFNSIGISIDFTNIVKLISKIVLLILLVYFFVLKDKCDKIYCLTLMQFLIGTITYHSFALFIIPLVYFSLKKELNDIDFILFVLMTIMMTLTFFLFFIPPYMFIPDIILRGAIHSAYVDLLLTTQIIIFLASKKEFVLKYIKNAISVNSYNN